MSTNKLKDQSGFVSIIITMLLMIVITVIIVGFARYSSREQRAALDRQLSTQAFYAAESAVNDARKVIANQLAAGNTINPKTNCNPSGQFAGVSNQVDGTIVQYSCLLINPYPPDLQYNPVSTNSSTVVDFRGSDAAGNPRNIRKLRFSWQATDGSPVFDNSFFPDLPRDSQWVNGGNSITGILRTNITVVDDSSGDGYSRALLNLFSYTAYLYPRAGTGMGTGTYSPGPIGPGDIVDGHCNASNTPAYCNVDLDLGSDQTHLLLRLDAIYEDVRVIVTALDSSNNPVNIRGGQVLVDSTGKANDVLRRVQVRIPQRANGTYPRFGIQSMTGICKQYTVAPGYGDDGACNYP